MVNIMTHAETVAMVRSMLEYHENRTTYTDEEESSRWGAIGALEAVLEQLESNGAEGN